MRAWKAEAAAAEKEGEIDKLAERGILSDDDTREIYDQALLALEQSAAAADGDDMRRVYAAARRILEDPLRDI